MVLLVCGTEVAPPTPRSGQGRLRIPETLAGGCVVSVTKRFAAGGHFTCALLIVADIWGEQFGVRDFFPHNT